MSRIVVTAEFLADLHRAGRAIELPRDALVTPAARDWLKEHAVPISWTDRSGGTDAAAGGMPVVIDLRAPMMRSQLVALERALGHLETIDPAERAGGLIAAVRKLCEDVSAGRSARGLIFADDAALSVCVANKFRGVRAALATTMPAVEQAVRELAVNVLVIEPSRQTMHMIRQMVQRFVTVRPSEAARAALDAIAGLEGAPRADR